MASPQAEATKAMLRDIREQAIGWSFPLVGWPVGSFRLQVTVTDEISAVSASAQVDFAIHE